MSDALDHAALGISGMLFAGLLEGAIVVAAVWIFLRALPKLGAATRYAIWLSALVMVAIAPVCTIALGGQRAGSSAAAPVSTIVAPDSNVSARMQTVSAPQPQGQRPTPVLASVPNQQRTRIDIPSSLSIAIAAAWLVLVSVRIAVLLVNLRALAMLRRTAQKMRDESGFPVLVTDRTNVPLAVGFKHPAVVLPSFLSADLQPEAIDAIVMHEIAHLQRYDVWSNALVRVLEAILMLNPFAWFVLKRLSVEREIACDDWVVARLDAGEVFANALANMALRPAFAPIGAPSAIGSKHAVVARIEHLLDRRPRSLRLSPMAVTAMVVLLTLFATTVPTISPVLAFTPQAAVLASAAGCANRPPLMQVLDMRTMRPTNRWVPLKSNAAKLNDPKNTAIDITIDANGKLSKMVVVSTPHKRDGVAAKWYFGQMAYRPAIANCKAVASTVHIAFLIDIAPPAPISIVRAEYPNGWSSEHPGACRVPDLTHGGVPDVKLVTNKPVSASVLVRVGANGKVVDATLSKSSGNGTYDSATLAAARGAVYPLSDSIGFKPVRPSGASMSWNATHGYGLYSKCTPLPNAYVWTTTFPAASD